MHAWRLTRGERCIQYLRDSGPVFTIGCLCTAGREDKEVCLRRSSSTFQFVPVLVARSRGHFFVVQESFKRSYSRHLENIWSAPSFIIFAYSHVEESTTEVLYDAVPYSTKVQPESGRVINRFSGNSVYTVRILSSSYIREFYIQLPTTTNRNPENKSHD
jgi:hypothetical protein